MGSVRYTVVGLWHGAPAEVSWERGHFFGPDELVMEIETAVQSGQDVSSLEAALALIGRTLDQVDGLLVDDAAHPWDFDARPIRPASAWRRKQMYEAGG